MFRRYPNLPGEAVVPSLPPSGCGTGASPLGLGPVRGGTELVGGPPRPGLLALAAMGVAIRWIQLSELWPFAQALIARLKHLCSQLPYFDKASPRALPAVQTPSPPARKAARLAALVRNANSAPAPLASCIARIRPLIYPPAETGRGIVLSAPKR